MKKLFLFFALAGFLGLSAQTTIQPQEKPYIEVTGTAEIRMLVSFGKTKIAGCMVTSGKLMRGMKVRVLRKDEVVYTGALATLRRAKDDVKEVANGYECGMTFEGFTQFHEGDIVEGYVLKEVKRTIDDLKALGQKQKAAEKAAAPEA